VRARVSRQRSPLIRPSPAAGREGRRYGARTRSGRKATWSHGFASPTCLDRCRGLVMIAIFCRRRSQKISSRCAGQTQPFSHTESWRSAWVMPSHSRWTRTYRRGEIVLSRRTWAAGGSTVPAPPTRQNSRTSRQPPGQLCRDGVLPASPRLPGICATGQRSSQCRYPGARPPATANL
jgi:hypothetical protein